MPGPDRSEGLFPMQFDVLYRMVLLALHGECRNLCCVQKSGFFGAGPVTVCWTTVWPVSQACLVPTVVKGCFLCSLTCSIEWYYSRCMASVAICVVVKSLVLSVQAQPQCVGPLFGL